VVIGEQSLDLRDLALASYEACELYRQVASGGTLHDRRVIWGPRRDGRVCLRLTPDESERSRVLCVAFRHTRY